MFQWLNQRGFPYCLVTNNSTKTPDQYLEKLLPMGIDVPRRTIFTSALATSLYLAKRNPAGAPVFVIGEDGMDRAMREAGFWLDPENPRYVCVGLDQQVTYKKLQTAALAIRKGAEFIGANPDKTLPTEIGLVPGNGAVLAAIEMATDVSPTVIGKPSAEMIHLAIEILGVNPERTAIVGDRLDTDILAGARAGITTILILTGVHHESDILAFPAAPNWIVEDLDQLRAALAGAPVARPYPGGVV